MSGTITALRFQKRNQDRVNVYLDDQFAFGLTAIKAVALRVGQVLSDDDIARLQEYDQIERACERALNFISYRPRSEAEVRRNLCRKKVDDEIVEAAVERLTRADLLNDLEFARYWVENRLQFNPRGARALRYELGQKGVAASIVAQVLENFDEGSSARQAAEAGARRLAHLEIGDFCRKLKGYITRRGFSYAVIEPLVAEMSETVCCENLSDVESEENDNV